MTLGIGQSADGLQARIHAMQVVKPSLALVGNDHTDAHQSSPSNARHPTQLRPALGRRLPRQGPTATFRYVLLRQIRRPGTSAARAPSQDRYTNRRTRRLPRPSRQNLCQCERNAAPRHLWCIAPPRQRETAEKPVSAMGLWRPEGFSWCSHLQCFTACVPDDCYVAMTCAANHHVN